jgi:DnaA family protein
MKKTVREQLLLSHVRARPDARLSDFAGEAYAALVAAGQGFVATSSGLLYLHGPAGSGRTHFLAALCAEAESAGLQAVLVPLSEVMHEPPVILDGLEQTDLLALDDVQAVAGRGDWEEALFHLYNRCRVHGTRVVVSAAGAPSSLGIRLPDLVSRLAQAPVWGLGIPDDASREALIVAAASRRGWVLESDVLRYLVQRSPRQPGELLACLESLDRRSMQEGRRLTIPFVRACLEASTDQGAGG